MKCNYCGNDAEWCENKIIYGKNYGKSFMCWYCKDCDAYVGCHNNTKKSLGTMANKELRRLRRQCHAFIDLFWKKRIVRRYTVYAILHELFGRHIHIGEADIDTCKKIISKEFRDLFVKQIFIDESR